MKPPAGKPGTLTWLCPVCGRRVPRREAECFCGAKQEQVQQRQQAEAERSPTRIPLDVAGLVVAIVLVGVYAVHRVTRPADEDAYARGAERAFSGIFRTPEPEIAPSAVGAPPADAPAPQVAPAEPRQPVPAPTPVPAPAETPTPPASPPPPLPRSVVPSATPPPPDEREQRRVEGIRSYEGALERLAPLAARLGEHVRVFKTECVGGPRFAYAVSNCDEIEATIRRSAAEIRDGLDAAEDAARRAWVEPGAVREARARSFFGTGGWDELSRAARDPRR